MWREEHIRNVSVLLSNLVNTSFGHNIINYKQYSQAAATHIWSEPYSILTKAVAFLVNENNKYVHNGRRQCVSSCLYLDICFVNRVAVYCEQWNVNKGPYS
jgi:hypothetical protein